MQKTPRYSLMRRLLFPYSGEEPLTFRQGMRVMLAWALLIPILISLLVVVAAMLMGFSLQSIPVFFLLAFLSGLGIFGILGLLIVLLGNHAARIRRAMQAQKGQ